MKSLGVVLFALTIIVGTYLSLTGDYFYTTETKELGSKENKASSVLFLGDMMFDRAIRQIAEDKGYSHLFSCAKDILLEQTAVVANLEGPITDNESVSKGTKPGNTDNFQFTFEPKITDTLVLSNIGYVNIGNNHILNFGQGGLKETKKYLDKVGIKYFGSLGFSEAGEPLLATSSVAHVPVDTRELALVNYNQFWYPDATTTTGLIEREKSEGRFVVVYAHWGEEYATTSNSIQQELAHRFVESGADAVIGSHPHVVQEVEEYLGRPIFYSLGNFIFDQWWNNEVRTGLGVRMTFEPNEPKPKFDTIRFVLNKNGTTCPVLGEDGNNKIS